MAAAVSGVTVVTTDGVAGRWGLTVSSAASVSAEPPMLLVCVNWRSPLAEAIRINNVLGVNVLGVHHTELAESFAGRLGLRPPYDFGDPRWRPGSSGVPLLADAAARFDCHVSQIVDAGSHAIVIATVADASRGAVPALAYTRRDYARAERLG
jgi:flavin reductase (DIM6/NTAB) family NADH-FMN oxidoreductase RutF